jgi:hypothetical protein
MTTAIPLTLHLLVLIGVYELAAGVAGLAGRINWAAMLDEFERSSALTFITGFAVYILGGVLVLVHNIWTDVLAGIVSAVGWIAAIEGVLIMTVPGPLLAFSRRLVGNSRLISALAAAFGIILILLGLTGRADPTSNMVIS